MINKIITTLGDFISTCVIIINSISVTSSNVTKLDIPEEAKFEWSNFGKGTEIEIHSLLLMDQLSFEGIQHLVV